MSFSNYGLLLFLFVLLISDSAFAQTIAFQNFESGTDNWSFTNSPATYNVSNDVWDEVGSVGSIGAPSDGSVFWGMRDLNNPNGGGNFFHELEFTAIDVSTSTDVILRFDYNYDISGGSENIKYNVQYDNGSTWPSGDDVFILNGGSGSSSGWQTITINVPPGSNFVRLRLSARFDGGSDYAGWDHLRLSGTAGSACGITSLSPEVITCNSNTPGANNDGLTISIPYTGVDAMAMIVNNAGGSTATSDDPAVTSDGNIIITGLSEGDSWDVTISGGSCNLNASGTVAGTLCDPITTPLAFINEFHYDNIGLDVNEFVEIAIDNNFAGSLSDFQVTLYNGATSGPYNTETMDNFMFGSSAEGFTFYIWMLPANGIQNGDPDGISLAYQGTLIEFISYEGIFTATNGDAAGATSVDVGPSESNSTTAAGTSIQRTGACNGTCPNGLSWTGGIPDTKGSINSSQSLPVELSSFTARQVDDQVVLNWTTLLEIDNDYFSILHSKDGRQFTDIGQVRGANRTASPSSYSFRHDQPVRNLNYYQLKQVDLDGTTSFFGPISVSVNGLVDDFLEIYPNPSIDRINLTFSSQETDRACQIFHMEGLLVKQTKIPAGMQDFSLSIDDLPPGMYIVQIGTNDHWISQRLIKK